jgi:IS5 family transposase
LPKHELVLLRDAMDWLEIKRSFSVHYLNTTSRQARHFQLTAGLLYLQHAYGCSEEIAVNTLLRNRIGSASPVRPMSFLSIFGYRR